MITKRILIPFLFSTLIMSTFVPSLLFKQAHAQFTYPNFHFSPTNYYGRVGEDINISVVLSGAINVFMYQAQVDYSPDLLSVVRITEGDFLGRGGAYPTFWRAVNNTPGTLGVVNSLLSGGSPVSGIGELFIITFRVEKPGGSILDIHSYNLWNSFGSQIIPVESEDGMISTTKAEFSPNFVRGGPTFDVNLTLSGTIENLRAVDFEVSYDKTILNATSATILETLGTVDPSSPVVNATEEGKIRLTMTLQTPTNTTGAVATLTFEVIQSGSTSVNISNSTLTDHSGNPIYHLLGKMSFTDILRNVAITSAAFSTLEVTAGDNITETVTIKNEGTLNETVTIVTHALDMQNNITTLTGGPVTLDMTAESNTTITLTLSTIGLDGNFTLRTFIFYIPDEATTEDNEWIASQQLEVNPKPQEAPSIVGPSLYIAIAVVVIVIIVAAIYLLKRKPKN